MVADTQTIFSNMTSSVQNYNNETRLCQIKFKKPDCFSSKIKLLQRSYYVLDGYGQLRFILGAPQAYNYYTIQSMRTSFLEFFGNIGGTVSIWVGWSFYDLSKLPKLLLKKSRNV